MCTCRRDGRLELRSRMQLPAGLILSLQAACGGGGGGGGDDRPTPPISAVDQGFWPTPLPPTSFVVGDSATAQVFTVGHTGMLTRVDLSLGHNMDGVVRIDARPAPGGVPDMDDGTWRASMTFDTQTELTEPGFIEYTWLRDTDSFAVNRGETYAICLHSLGGRARVSTRDLVGYGGGDAHWRTDTDPASAWGVMAVWDLLFRTWVRP